MSSNATRTPPERTASPSRAWRWSLGATAGLALGLGLVLSLTSRESPEPTSTKPSASPSKDKTPAPTPTLARSPTRAPPSVPSIASESSGRRALITALTSDNDGVRIDGVRAAGEQGLTELLPLLEAQSLTKDPALAPSLIITVGKLAASAESADRDRAARTLARWLNEQSRRNEADARGNVSVLVKTLGTVPSQASIDALLGVLGWIDVPTHVKTVAVTGLSNLGSPEARTAIERFRRELADFPEVSGFEAELVREADQAAAEALASLDH